MASPLHAGAAVNDTHVSLHAAMGTSRVRLSTFDFRHRPSRRAHRGAACLGESSGGVSAEKSCGLSADIARRAFAPPRRRAASRARWVAAHAPELEERRVARDGVVSREERVAVQRRGTSLRGGGRRCVAVQRVRACCVAATLHRHQICAPAAGDDDALHLLRRGGARSTSAARRQRRESPWRARGKKHAARLADVALSVRAP
jgi:hypothetical protein